MKHFLLFIGLGLSTITFAQKGECEMSYVSHHFVLNSTSNTVTILVDNKNQKSFPTKGPKIVSIAPNERIEVSKLEWAGTFKDPTIWYVFKVETEGLTPLCDSKNWKFKKLSETQGEHTLILLPSDAEKCELNEIFLLDEGLRSPEEATEQEEPIYDFADPDAEFPGGIPAMQKWIMSNVKYPKEALEKNIQGRVYVRFVVEKTGELSNITIMRSPHDLLSVETIRIIKLMPKWEPGRIGDDAVRMRYALPISFTLDI